MSPSVYHSEPKKVTTGLRRHKKTLSYTPAGSDIGTPREIRRDVRLSPNARILGEEVCELATNTKNPRRHLGRPYCYAGSRFLAGRLGIGAKSLKRLLAELDTAGYIRMMADDIILMAEWFYGTKADPNAGRREDDLLHSETVPAPIGDSAPIEATEREGQSGKVNLSSSASLKKRKKIKKDSGVSYAKSAKDAEPIGVSEFQSFAKVLQGEEQESAGTQDELACRDPFGSEEWPEVAALQQTYQNPQIVPETDDAEGEYDRPATEGEKAFRLLGEGDAFKYDSLYVFAENAGRSEVFAEAVREAVEKKKQGKIKKSVLGFLQETIKRKLKAPKTPAKLPLELDKEYQLQLALEALPMISGDDLQAGRDRFHAMPSRAVRSDIENSGLRNAQKCSPALFALSHDDPRWKKAIHTYVYLALLEHENLVEASTG